MEKRKRKEEEEEENKKSKWLCGVCRRSREDSETLIFAMEFIKSFININLNQRCF